jgi:hypothetical protein
MGDLIVQLVDHHLVIVSHMQVVAILLTAQLVHLIAHDLQVVDHHLVIVSHMQVVAILLVVDDMLLVDDPNLALIVQWIQDR